MNLQEYIDSKRFKTFEWGKHDCYTFTRDWIDLNYPQNRLPKLEYKTNREAYRASHQMSWVKEIQRAFDYRIIENFDEVTDGDLFITKYVYQCSHIVFNDAVWSIDQAQGLIALPLSVYQNKPFLRLIKAY